MKRVLFFALMLLSGLMMEAGNPIEIKVWPQGAPTDNGMKAQKDGDLKYAEAILTVYPAKNGNGMAIVACPGGAYRSLAVDHEGKSMASWFNAQGITYAVLEYRMPNNGHYDVPLSDAQEALRIMRRHSDEWNVQKLGIMGSSAGGHLASTVATHFTDAETRPDFQILFYPVITMDPNYVHGVSRACLLGDNPSKELERRFSNELQVTAQTPPAFIMHSTNDKSVPVANSVNYYLALVRNNVSAALHIYPTGGHGWGYNDSFQYKRQWTGELEKWLREVNKSQK